MRKKTILFLSAVILSIFAVLGLSACSDDNKDNLLDLDFSSVYAMAQEAGYEGTLEELIKAFKGDKGDAGPAGKGITKIEKTSTIGNVDTYTITFTDETTTTFNVTNGSSGSGAATKFTVKFDADNGLDLTTQEVQFGNKIIKPIDPIKEGYSFKGWYIDDELWSFNGYSVSEEITLKAKWDSYLNVLTKQTIEKTINSRSPKYQVIFSTDYLDYDLVSKRILSYYGDILKFEAISSRETLTYYFRFIGNETEMYSEYDGLWELDTYPKEGLEYIKEMIGISDIDLLLFQILTNSTAFSNEGEFVDGKYELKSDEGYAELNYLLKNVRYFLPSTNKEVIDFVVEETNGLISKININIESEIESELVVNNAIIEINYNIAEIILPEIAETFELYIQKRQGGTVRGNDKDYYAAGVEIYLSAHPDSGYEFGGWYDYDYNLLSEDTNFTLIMPGNDYYIEVKFNEISEESFSIEVEFNIEQGSVSGHEGQFSAGDNVTLTARPQEGYKFIGWYENGNEINTDKVYSFTMPENDRYLTAKFSQIK